MSHDFEELGGSLQLRIWVTRGCYFVLADRLRRKSHFSARSTTAIAFYILSVAIILLVYGATLSADVEAGLNTFAVILSVFLIIITLMETARQYDVDAHSARTVAHQLERLYNDYEINLKQSAEDQSTKDESNLIAKKYSEILYEAKLSRKEVDYHLFRLMNAEALKVTKGGFVWLVFLVSLGTVLEYWLYAFMVLLPPVAIAALFYWAPKIAHSAG